MLDALSPEELQFIKAIEQYKKLNNKHFLSWTEVLSVVKATGYRKVAKEEEIPITARSKRRKAALLREQQAKEQEKAQEEKAQKEAAQKAPAKKEAAPRTRTRARTTAKRTRKKSGKAAT